MFAPCHASPLTATPRVGPNGLTSVELYCGGSRMRPGRMSHGRSSYPSDPRPQKGPRPGVSSWCLRSTYTRNAPTNLAFLASRRNTSAEELLATRQGARVSALCCPPRNVACSCLGCSGKTKRQCIYIYIYISPCRMNPKFRGPFHTYEMRPLTLFCV